jgi:hypothetical protein
MLTLPISKCEDMTRGGATQLQFEVRARLRRTVAHYLWLLLITNQACLAEMPFAKAMRIAILQVHSSGVDCRILSDANTFFISSFLKSHGIDHCFSRVVSNPATWSSGVLRVAPHTPWGQSPACGFSCPENLCKVTAAALQMPPRAVRVRPHRLCQSIFHSGLRRL